MLLLGGLVLSGWIFEVDGLKSIYGPITMKTNAAIGLILVAASVLALHRRNKSPYEVLGQICALAAGLIGVHTLFEHLTGLNLRIDQLYSVSRPARAGDHEPESHGDNFLFMLHSIQCRLAAFVSSTIHFDRAGAVNDRRLLGAPRDYRLRPITLKPSSESRDTPGLPSYGNPCLSYVSVFLPPAWMKNVFDCFKASPAGIMGRRLATICHRGTVRRGLASLSRRASWLFRSRFWYRAGGERHHPCFPTGNLASGGKAGTGR